MKGNPSNNFYEDLKKIYEKEDGNLDAYNSEYPVLKKVFDRIIESDFKKKYELIKPIGRGGAGIVICVNDKNLKILKALKLPRPRGHQLIESVRNEIDYLTDIKHENIIKVHYLGEVEINDYPSLYPYFVMDYIENAIDLRKKILLILKEANSSRDLMGTTSWIVNKFTDIAIALDFLHSDEIIHFDIKPSNILVNKADIPILSDLGFAKKKLSDTKKVVVGFTYFYAHPDLKAEYRSMSSKDRVKKEISPIEFKEIYDIYSFGKSLLEILSIVDNQFPDLVFYDYTFVYLHFAACRMLDGKNLPKIDTDQIRQRQMQNEESVSIYKETWQNFDAQDFTGIRYESFIEIVADLKKLQIEGPFLESIPELKSFYPQRIQISQGTPASFSDRVKYIIEHPVFTRLSFVPQLGLLNAIYPTATHSRLEHSIGTFRNCCLYIQALYDDPYNPIFKQLMNEDDIKTLLLASLLHDLGQYPLAHEIGELREEFKHENFTLKFLDNETKDNNNRTIKEIIEDFEFGWGCKVENIKRLLGIKRDIDIFSEKQNIKQAILKSIIDGPIDVDKSDYLLRDSQNCYLKYGESIDFDRLVRSLTIIITKEKYERTICTIGTYAKGQTAAESLSFARYLLFQSLYWHHTSRAIRAMLKVALIPAFDKKKAREKYESFYKAIEDYLGLRGNPKITAIDDMLNLIIGWSDSTGKELIRMIKDRKYYKRILTIHSEPSKEENGKTTLLDRFRSASNKLRFQEILQSEIRKAFQSFLDESESRRESLLSHSKMDFALEMLEKPKTILCDCPDPSSVYGTTDKLRFIFEPKRLHHNYFIRSETGERISEVWNQVYFRLMNIVAKGRIFCHPDIRDTLMAGLGPQRLIRCLEVTTESHYTKL